MLARRQLRLAAKTAIEALTGVTVASPGDWETAPAKIPEIKLRCGGDQKARIASSAPNFTTTVTLEILATVEGATAEAAQDALEALGARLEDVVFGCLPLIRIVQQIAGVSTKSEITSRGGPHIGRQQMWVQLETFESFNPIDIDPSLAAAINDMRVHVDTASPFDGAGTYTSLPFPDAVAAAPRTTGPDGRDEGYLQINLNP